MVMLFGFMSVKSILTVYSAATVAATSCGNSKYIKLQVFI